jgi:recombination DNA repair RAD52 pathway protein
MDMSTMLLDQAAKDALRAPLDLNNVKKRKGAGGRTLDYISGEHAIAEANRIFGFDGWSCETIHMECVKESPITYIARVRVKAGGVTREGWGGDSSHDHEMAVKGAETDAIKRALRTFGNQFGLPLYDKEENAENLTRGSEPAPTLRPDPSPEYKRQEKVIKEEIQDGPFYTWKTKIMNAGPSANWMIIEKAIREGKDAAGKDLGFTNAHKQDLMKALNARKAEVEKVATA